MEILSVYLMSDVCDNLEPCDWSTHVLMLQKVQVYSIRCTVADQQGGNGTHFDDEDQTEQHCAFFL